jgi:hypothetical protein
MVPHCSNKKDDWNRSTTTESTPPRVLIVHHSVNHQVTHEQVSPTMRKIDQQRSMCDMISRNGKKIVLCSKHTKKIHRKTMQIQRLIA